MKSTQSSDKLVLSQLFYRFDAAYNEVLNRVKYLVHGDKDKLKKLKDRLDDMALNIYATEYFMSDDYDSRSNNINLKIPKLILKKHNIYIEGVGLNINRTSKQIYDLIYNDAALYDSLIHEAVHGLQAESSIKMELDEQRRDYRLRGDILHHPPGYKPKINVYTDLKDEQASNLEAIFTMKKRGITKEEYKKSVYVNYIRQILHDFNMDLNNIGEDKTEDMIEYIRENADYQIGEYIEDYPLEEELDENEWDRYTPVLKRIPFSELKNIFFRTVKYKANSLRYNNEVYQFVMKNWDNVKMERKEVAREMWGSNVAKVLVKIADEFDMQGLYKQASVVDSILIKIANDINEGEIHRWTDGKMYQKQNDKWQPVGHYGEPVSLEDWGEHSDYVGKEPYDLTEYQYSYDYKDGGFNEDEYNKNYDTIAQKRREWERRLLEAVTMGKLDPEVAKERGLYNQYQFKDLPETLYHVTTAKSKVLSGSKLKSRMELSEEYGSDYMKGGHPGLGGGDDKSISFTEDINIARDIKKGIFELREVLRGGTKTVEKMIDEARKGIGTNGEPWIDGVESHLKSSVGVTIDMLINKKTIKSVNDIKFPNEIRHYMAAKVKDVQSIMPEAEPTTTWAGGDGELRAGWFKVPMSQEEYDRALYYFYNGWASYREHAGGPIYPLFFLTDTEKIKNIPEGEVTIIEVKTLPGKKGTQESSLGEWRIYTGDAVEVVGEVE